jgi:hypothetical protein
MPIQVKIFSKTKDMYRERSYATARCQKKIIKNNNNNNNLLDRYELISV